MDIKLSIIIPHYNSVNKLKKLIETIPKRSDIEIIVIDDYSADTEVEELKNLVEDTNIKIYKNHSKKSAGSCRNIGLKHAIGKWLLFADSDDFFLPDMYGRVSQYFNQDVDIVFFSPTSVISDTNELSNRHLRNEELVEKFIIDKNRKNELHLRTKFVEPWSKLFNRKFVKKNFLIFDETLISNDVYFSVSTGVLANTVLASPETIYCVTKSSGSITTIVTKERFKIRFDVFIKQVNFLKKNISEQDYYLLEIDSKSWIVGSILNKFGFKYTWALYKELRKNKITIINLKKVSINRLFKFIRFWNTEKKYQVPKE